MHISAKCGIAIACLSVRPSATLVDQDSGPHRLEGLETNCMGK